MIGIQDLHDAVWQQSYPLDREGLSRAIGELTVFDASGNPIVVRDVLTHSDRFEFGTPQEVMDEIDRCVGRR